MRAWSRRASAGDAPDVEMAICSGPRSTTEAMTKLDRSASSATLTAMPAACAASATSAFTAGSSVAAITSCASARSATSKRFARWLAEPSRTRSASASQRRGATIVSSAPQRSSARALRAATSPPPTTTARLPRRSRKAGKSGGRFSERIRPFSRKAADGVPSAGVLQAEARRLDLSLDAIEPALGRLLHHVEHPLEALDAAVVRVRHVLALPAGARVQEEADARLRTRGRDRAQDAQVPAVHREDVVVLVEVALAHLRGAQRRKVVAALRGMAHGSGIGRFTDVVVVGCGGGDTDAIGEATLLDPFAQHTLGGRGAADVPGAHDEDRDRLQRALRHESPPTAIRRSRSVFNSSRRVAARSNSRFLAASSISFSILRMRWSSCFSESDSYFASASSCFFCSRAASGSYTPSMRSLMRLEMPLGSMPCARLNATCFARRRSVSPMAAFIESVVWSA